MINEQEIVKKKLSEWGKKSVKTRFKGKTKKEISEMMKKVSLANKKI